jgi:hypothetical protein
VFVILRTLTAAVAVVAIPIAVLGADRPAKSGENDRRVCEVTGVIGTRLSNVRRCRTRAEREDAKQEARRVVDRIQSNRPSLCAPGFPSC